MAPAETTVDVYWRPGCGACRALQIALAEAGVVAAWHNIWDDTEASAFVRSFADGNETVPTVRIDGRTHVAPSPRGVLDEISRVAPHLIRRTRRWPPLRIVQWVAITAVLVASTIVSRSGHVGWSYALGGLAILTYTLVRRLRARAPRRALSPPATGDAHRFR